MQGACLCAPTARTLLEPRNADASEGQNPFRREAGQRRPGRAAARTGQHGQRLGAAGAGPLRSLHPAALRPRRRGPFGRDRCPLDRELGRRPEGPARPRRHRQGAPGRPFARHPDPAALRGGPSAACRQARLHRRQPGAAGGPAGRDPRAGRQGPCRRHRRDRRGDRQGRPLAAHAVREAGGRRLRARAAHPAERRGLCAELRGDGRGGRGRRGGDQGAGAARRRPRRRHQPARQQRVAAPPTSRTPACRCSSSAATGTRSSSPRP